MHNLKMLDNFQLIDLLARHTSDCTKMITDNNMGDEYEKCKVIIKAIQTEIEIRKNSNILGDTNITPVPDFT